MKSRNGPGLPVELYRGSCWVLPCFPHAWVSLERGWTLRYKGFPHYSRGREFPKLTVVRGWGSIRGKHHKNLLRSCSPEESANGFCKRVNTGLKWILVLNQCDCSHASVSKTSLIIELNPSGGKSSNFDLLYVMVQQKGFMSSSISGRETPLLALLFDHWCHVRIKVRTAQLHCANNTVTCLLWRCFQFDFS